MADAHVIARFVAREGRESQLRALLQGMLAPTRAESGCEPSVAHFLGAVSMRCAVIAHAEAED
jgi:hypothetical protein